MIKLTDFLIACKIPLDLHRYKIHLATMGTTSPLEEFFAGTFQKWQEDQSRQNFKCQMIVSLIQLEKGRWLFAGVFRVLDVEKQSNGRFLYSTELLEDQENLIGRVIVDHRRRGRQAYLVGREGGGDFAVAEILPRRMSIEEFPGYNSVSVRFPKLKIIIEQSIPSWRGALSNMKGVYLITDLSTGRLYVGSATGDDGIWQRWAAYVQTGHGGNRDLRAVLKDKGPDHVQNSQYSLLEIADSRANDEYILSREAHWKNMLASREFGYNAN